MSIILDTRFHIWFIMTLYNKTRQILLQNVTAILLQNAIEVYYKVRQMFYYKMRQFYYKIRQLLRNATILLQNATFITNCDSTPFPWIHVFKNFENMDFQIPTLPPPTPPSLCPTLLEFKKSLSSPRHPRHLGKCYTFTIWSCTKW